MGPLISVVVNTLNEERNLPHALRSVHAWADEIVVVDMYSQDRTAEIAAQFGAKVCLHKGPGFDFPPREFAVAQASGDWVLILDADELVPVALSRELRSITGAADADVVLVPRLNYLLGSPMMYSGWGPKEDAQPRFFKKGKIRASSIAHQDFTPAPGARTLKLRYNGNNAIIHFNYLDEVQFLEKLNRYTSIEAQQAWARGEQATPLRALVASAREFKLRFIEREGFRDGWRGFYLSLFMAFYRLATFAKMTELDRVGNREAVEAIYSREREKVLAEYETEATSSTAP